MKTYQPSSKEITRTWRVMDAKDKILGRFATEVAIALTGKDKVTYSTHMDSGDFVVVLNSEKVKVTGRKASQKVYRSHSGYPGGFRERKFSKVINEHPERILENAISGMLPDNKLKAKRMARLRVVVGDKNPYSDKIEK